MSTWMRSTLGLLLAGSLPMVAAGQDMDMPAEPPPAPVAYEGGDEAVEPVESMQEEAPLVEEAPVEETLIPIEAARTVERGIQVTEEESDLITLTLDDVPLQDVIRMFTRISGANIVAGTNLQGSVTVSLRDVAWKPALDVILDSVGMMLVERQSGIYMVMSQSELSTAPMLAETIFLNFTTPSNVVPVVQRMLVSSNASVSAVSGANGIVVQETVSRIQTIKDTVRQLDRERPQVYIEAKFVELSDTASRQIGVDWEVLRGYNVGATGLRRSYTETFTRQRQDAEGFLGVNQTASGNRTTQDRVRSFDNVANAPLGDVSSSTNPRFTDNNTSDLNAVASGRNFETMRFEDGQLNFTTIPSYLNTTVQSAILSAADFNLVLSALQDNNGVSVVSNPKIIVANGETAKIHVGRNEPNIVAVPTGDTGDRFAYTLDSTNPFIEIGVKVDVTPTVNTESNITVRITPELSRLLGQKAVGQAEIEFPITQIRKVETEFNLRSGYTAAIGGLTQTEDRERVKKIPLLGSIPIIGKYLFSHSSTEKVQDEVIIFVTVGMAKPDTLGEISGVPSEGRLIHQHLARKNREEQGAGGK